MNILITSGGTSEKIDDVRSITNSSTGRLGCAIAEAFATLPQTSRIFYLHSKGAAKPSNAKTTFIEIEGVDSLETEIKNLFADFPVDIIIHAMAVSDYKVASVSAISTKGGTPKFLDLSAQGGKISSDAESLILILEKTQKIIKMFRPLAPHAVLVGFKLLSNVPRETLFEAAQKLMAASSCDFVLANDGAGISGDSHVGYLLDKAGNNTKYLTKTHIAQGITHAALNFRRDESHE